MANLLDQIQSQITPDVLTKLATLTGENPDKVFTAVAAAAPSVIGGAISQAASPAGAQQLLDAMGSPEVANSATALLGDRAQTLGVLRAGQSLVNSLFGAQSRGVTETVSALAGISPSSAANILASVAPLALAAAGNALGADNLNPAALTSLLSDQRQALAAALPSEIAGLLNFTAPAAPAPEPAVVTAVAAAAAAKTAPPLAKPAAPPAAAARPAAPPPPEPARRSFAWIWWVIVLLVLLALGWWFLLRPQTATAPSTPPAPATATRAATTAAPAAAATTPVTAAAAVTSTAAATESAATPATAAAPGKATAAAAETAGTPAAAAPLTATTVVTEAASQIGAALAATGAVTQAEAVATAAAATSTAEVAAGGAITAPAAAAAGSAVSATAEVSATTAGASAGAQAATAAVCSSLTLLDQTVTNSPAIAAEAKTSDLKEFYGRVSVVNTALGTAVQVAVSASALPGFDTTKLNAAVKSLGDAVNGLTGDTAGDAAASIAAAVDAVKKENSVLKTAASCQ